MSDTFTTDPAAGTETDPTAGAATDTGTTDAADLFDNPETQQFPREYVEKLRKEAADKRTALKEYEDVFGGIDPGDKQVWLNMAKEMYRDPRAGAEYLKRVAEGVLSGMTQEEAEDAAGREPAAKPEGAEEQPKPLTADQLEKWYADKRAAEDAQRAQEQAVADITSEAEKLGYKDGTAEFNNLLWIALNETNGDMAKAHEKLEANKQAIIDEYVQSIAGKTRGVRQPAAGLPHAPGRPPEIKNLDDAKRAAKLRLEAMAAAGH